VRASGAPDTTVAAVSNPLPAFLSDEPPFLDAAAREQYTTRLAGDTTIAGVAARWVEAEFVANGRRTQPVRFVRAAVDPERGGLLSIVVRREVDSSLFDETSRLRATLARGTGGLVPGWARVETRTDVPGSEPRSARLLWRRLP
jgi:hypothetical protein